ncbi:MAG: cbb3-type cytochrome oxidase assembly protein CcoS [Cyclobacteriaceae bacterium]|nr:cbb3-type cytochrome oxidase assembly protein CcoS [Cyclobacteriaceae bacterium]
MLIITVLILISVAVALIFLIAFFWAVKSGQYDDTYSPSVRMLFDDEKNKNEETSKNGNKPKS